MAQVTITINSREYPIACEDGQEDRILYLAGVLDEKAKLLKNISGQINESMLLAMIGILVADDLVEAKKRSASNESEKMNAKQLEEADTAVSVKLKNVLDEIKSVANELKML